MANYRSKLGALAIAVAAFGAAGSAQATDLTFFKTVFDTDFASAGYGGMRNNGTGTINLAGTSGTIAEAYLFWHGPSNAATADAATANQTVSFNGTDVTGSFLGISDNNCWGFANSLAYRADVSSLVTGDGNYSLANFVKDSNNINVNGVSLIVFFDDGNDANNRDVVMFNGNDSNITNAFDANGWNITLAGINYSAGTASAQFHVSDGQTFGDAALIANGTELAPAGPVFQGDTTPAGTGFQSLWDIRDFSVTSLLNPGLNDLNITTGVGGDCLSCVMIAIDLPAGSAPDNPDDNDVPEPGSLLLAGLALSGLAMARRRRRSI
jgi:hypothetical protein